MRLYRLYFCMMWKYAEILERHSIFALYWKYIEKIKDLGYCSVKKLVYFKFKLKVKLAIALFNYILEETALNNSTKLKIAHTISRNIAFIIIFLDIKTSLKNF